VTVYCRNYSHSHTVIYGGRNMNRTQGHTPSRATGTNGAHHSTATTKFIEETKKTQVNNDVMFAKMATNIEAIGNYIKEMKSTTALNTSNNPVAQPKLINHEFNR
jgi:hypothetical protein